MWVTAQCTTVVCGVDASGGGGVMLNRRSVKAFLHMLLLVNHGCKLGRRHTLTLNVKGGHGVQEVVRNENCVRRKESSPAACILVGLIDQNHLTLDKIQICRRAPRES